MDIYSRKSQWKTWLLVAAAVIVAISLIYTSQIARRIAMQERERVEQWAGAVLELNKSLEDTLCNDLNLDYISSIVITNQTIPVILTDLQGNILAYRNLNDEKAQNDVNYLLRQKKEMAATHDSLLIETKYYRNYVFYKNSTLYTLLTYFPFFQLGLITVFLAVAYMGFSAARRAEQNQVWVGMAKETAHQLGTPISGLVAWLEHLDMAAEDNPYLQEIVQDMRHDIDRLQLVSERFSKVGATPELHLLDLVPRLAASAVYMQKRAAAKIVFNYPDPDQQVVLARINPQLFDWVIENLLKNALDAMTNVGRINITVHEDPDSVYVDVEDTGKGIPASKFKTVFKPGYSTKARGWGLGLSLSYRIIRYYHAGRIFVKQSVVGEGTTFRIQLPKH